MTTDGRGMAVLAPWQPGEWGGAPLVAAHFPESLFEEEARLEHLSREDLVLGCAARVGIGPSRRGILLGRDWRERC